MLSKLGFIHGFIKQAQTYGYLYAPEDVAEKIQQKGYMSAAQYYLLTGDAGPLEKYRIRSAKELDLPPEKLTPGDIIKGQAINRAKMGPEGAHAIYMLPSPIPKGISERHEQFRKRPMYRVNLAPYQNVLFGVDTAPGDFLEKLWTLRDVEREKRRALQAYQRRLNREFLFSDLPHIAITPESKMIPPEQLERIQ